MVRVTSFIAGVILTFICSTAAIADVSADEYRLMLAQHRAWNELCFELRDVDCTGMKIPYVEIEKMRKGLQGYYDGTDTVYIREGLTGDALREVLAHEMSHYIDVQLGLATAPVRIDDKVGVFNLCMSEKRAWAVSDAFWKARHYTNREVGGQWVKWYDHCRPYADRLYPDIYDKPLSSIRNWVIGWFS